MFSELEKLTESEKDLLVDAVPLVTVLIGGADGEFSPKEKEWATKLTNIRSYSYPDELSEYYKLVGEHFSQRLEELIHALPDNPAERNQQISEHLSRLNDIFPKLDVNIASRLYQSLLSFAEHVAKADGGFLRFAAINKEEKKWLKLPMIKPIEEPDQE